MSLFKPAENTTAYLKAGFFGFQGSGKTYTATLLAVGLIQHLRKLKVPDGDKPMFFLDTETGSDWVAEEIKNSGIELQTAKTRAFTDLMAAMDEAEKSASVLLIDSITHFWTELCETYAAEKAKQRRRQVYNLQFQDWGYLKGQWRRFTEKLVNGKCHVIVCGRAGFEYEHHVDEETGKKDIEKSGVKMKAEGEFGFEPSLLVYMKRQQDLTQDPLKSWRTATVEKDRSRTIDGKTFKNPQFKHFLPHIKFLNLGGEHLGVGANTSAETVPNEQFNQKRLDREIVLEEIKDLLLLHHPSTGAADKKAKAELLRDHFGTTSWTEIEKRVPLTDLQMNYDSLHQHLEKRESRYGQPPKEIDDAIPDFAEA